MVHLQEPLRGQVSWSRLRFVLLTTVITYFAGGKGEFPSAKHNKSELNRFNYGDALYKCILFFENQRSGRLPDTQRAKWRGDSGLSDGQDVGIDLTGGYYDAGDNVKFGLPMAYTATLLSWGVIEYRPQLASAGQLRYVEEAIKWITDYLLKAVTGPTELWVQVGNADDDHSCWERPEDMDTSRTSYKIDESNPGTEPAAETAAALAAASKVLSIRIPVIPRG